MTAVPAWLAATAGSAPKAANINQFLGTHPSVQLYSGTLQSSQTTAGAGHVGSNSTYLAQSFTTGASQTAIGYVIIPFGSFTASGANLATTTLSLYANSAGAPTGSALVSTTITTEYAYNVTLGVATVNVTYPLPITGLSPSTQYWLVTAPAGGAGVHYTWNQSNQTSGASTSTNGTTWTAQAYGFEYQVYDQTPSGPLTSTWEDAGARWTVRTYNTTNQITTLAEYTAGQTAAGYQQSYRTLSYTNSFVTGVS